MTKLFWACALLAVGFGVATLFGPPKMDATFYQPTISAYDRLPAVEGSPSVSVTPHRANGGRSAHPLPLRAGGEPDSLEPVRAVGSPEWNVGQEKPQWLKPAREVEPTSFLVAQDDQGVEFAAAEQVVQSGSPSNEAADVHAAARPAPAHDSLQPSQRTDRTTTQPPLDDTGPRPVYPTGNSFNNWPRWPTAAASAVEFHGDSSTVGPAGALGWPATEELSDEPPADVHVVVDGDTLQKLAARYLDDPNRGWEIYQINRDQLRSPELLPIGAVLKLPDENPLNQSASLPGNATPERPVVVARPVTEPVADAFSVSGRRPVEPAVVYSDEGMVPVRPISSPSLQVPEARLLQPVPVDWRQNQGSREGAGDNFLRRSDVSLVDP